MALYNRDFIEVAEKILNPTQMHISRNDGLCNTDLLPARDFLICANSLKSISRYSLEEIEQIERCVNSD